MKGLLIASIIASQASLGNASAQVYPIHPVTMVVPFPAGSAFDVTARTLAERMRLSLGQPVIIDNLTGAAGSVGTGRVAHAAPDGYTLCFGGLITHVINGAVLTLSYDVLKDFEPVSLVAATDLVIVGKKALPPDDLKGLIAWLKANPDKASQGSGGPGSLTHIAGQFFKKETGTRFEIVPYRGAGAAINDLVSGHIDIMFDLVPNSLPHMRAGTIKSYAVMAKSRLPGAPELPTVDEAGLPGFYMAAWEAIWVPKGTPKTIVQTLNGAIVDALANPTVRSRLADLGQQIFPRDQQTPQALAAFHKAELEKWWPIIKTADIKE
jgi:tripartite-type tricarboxylate transporter receptor subunit TctC